MNKTDVETLRASFGVRHILSHTLSHPVLPYSTQSFAKIAQADAAQLERLPGFGPKKVARLKDAFERPFRTGTAGDALPTPAPAALATATTSAPAVPAHPLPSSSSSGNKGTGRAGEDAVWDIELDLNSPSPEPASTKRARESPPWDIGLDEDTALPSRDDALSISSDDSDPDIAPALRAKRRRA